MIVDDWLHIFVLLQLEYKDFDLNYDIDLMKLNHFMKRSKKT